MKRIIFAAIALFCSLSLNAQTEKDKVRTITVDEAVILAADNNISLKRQRISLETLERRNKTSWNGVSPSASLSGGLEIPLEKADPSPMNPNPADYSYSVSVNVSLRLTPSLYTSIRDASLKYESGKTSYEEAVRQIELNVRKLFYSLLYTKESMNLQRRNMETARIRYENNRDKYNRGQLSELDLLQSQYSYESLRPNIESAEIAYQNSIASFKQTLGISQDEKIELSGTLSDAVPPESFSVNQAVDELPSIKKIKASIAQQENSLLATRFSAYSPSVTASYSWGMNGNDKTEEFKKGQESHSLSLSVNIPLDGYIPWTNGAQNVKNQKAVLQDLQLQLENERTTASLNLQNSIKNILQKQSQMDLIDRNVELAQKTYDMTLTAYNHGSRDLLTLQNSADSLLKAKTDRESKKYELISAVLDLENTLGIPFGTLGKE
jgi:outer membrane protein TolC